MKMLNQVKITFASRSVNEGFARAALAAFLVQLDPTVPQLADLKTAVSEAVTNCIVHAYPEGIGPVTLTAALYEGGVVRIRINPLRDIETINLELIFSDLEIRYMSPHGLGAAPA